MENSEAGSYIVDFLLPDGDEGAHEWNLWRVEKKGDGIEAVQYAMRIPAGSGVGGEEIIAARKKIVPELAEFVVPAAHGENSSADGSGETSGGGGGQTYRYPASGPALFSMELPSDWAVEGDDKGAYIVSADKKFTTSVVVVDASDIEDAVESIKKQSGGRFASVEWNDGPAKNDEATGMSMTSADGTAEDKGATHKLGVYAFSKEGGDKAFILSTWTPEAALSDNAAGIFQMLGSIKLN